jgi:predicted  nucleic acid-binding Zn-ribbon protein
MSDVQSNDASPSFESSNFPPLSASQQQQKKKRQSTKRVNSLSNGLTVRAKSPSDIRAQEELDNARQTIDNLHQDILKLNNTLADKNQEIETLQNKQNGSGHDLEKERKIFEKEKQKLEQQKVRPVMNQY